MTDGGDDLIGDNDYFEFYGQKNDGWLDSLVYTSPQLIANPDFSLFNDTAMYFLTFSDSPGALRCNEFFSADYSSYTPKEFCTYTSTVDFHSHYQIGKQDVNGISLPTYDEGEGWFAQAFPKGSAHVAEIPTPFVFSGSNAPFAKVYTISSGASMAQGNPNHHLQIGWGNPVTVAVDSLYSGYQLNKISFPLAPSSLGNQTTRITHRSVDDLGVATDFNAVSFVRITYPRLLNFNADETCFFSVINDQLSQLIYLEINYPQSSFRMFLMGEGLKTEIRTTYENGVIKALVPSQGLNKIDLAIVPSTQITDVDNISPVTQSGYFTDYISQELSNTFIIVTHPALWPAASNYATYRNTTGSQTLLVNVEELYMQYAAGIFKHPLALRRFCLDALQSWSTPPGHLFIIGKSIHEATFSSTVGARNDPNKYARNLVPTWGYQGSDIAITAGLFGTTYQPAIPTGRLAAQNIQQVQEYLNKIVEHENQPPAAWQKNILHFGGGGNAFEQGLFRNYLNNYSDIAADTSYGGRVHSFFKNTLEPIQINVSDSIQMLINQGAALMTFFGHASSSGFDQNIDSPQSYNNQGRYPVLIGNSCYTGNINLSDATSASENFVLVPDRGVIGFLAKADLGIPTYLNIYTDNLYRSLFREAYGSSIGLCMKRAVENFQLPGDFYRANAALTFAFHGDPSITIYPWSEPDYSISASSISFDPPQVSASDPFIRVSVVVENLGKAVNNDVGIELVRHFPDGTDTSYVMVVDRIISRDTVEFIIETDLLRGAGINTFDVFVDYPVNLIEELNDVSNNIVIGKSLLISTGEIYPVYPYEFSIIDNPQPVLKASTGNPLVPMRTYLFQADTTDLFNSPSLSSTSITQSGGVLSWPFPWILSDGNVVFWRCSPDSISPEAGYNWKMSSFRYRANTTGWTQKHFFQFDDNNLTNINDNRETRRWEFNPTEVDLKCEVYGAANTTFAALSTRYQLDLDVQEYGGYGFNTPALMVAVMDSATFIPWESNFNGSNPDHDFGNTLASANARNRPERYFIFQQNDASQLSGFADMINNGIPDGNYVLIYTWLLAQKQNWNTLAPQVTDVFESLGAGDIIAAPDSLPFILFMKKGHPSTLQTVVGSTSGALITLQRTLTGSTGSATIRGPVIGPGYNWEQCNWSFSLPEPAGPDSVRVKIYGLNDAGTEVLIANRNGIEESGLDLNAVSGINQFGRIRLEALVSDQAAFTAPQLNYWEIVHSQYPDFAINPFAGYYINSDSLQEGRAMKVAVAIENISMFGGDSVLVSYAVEDRDKNRHQINYPRQRELAAGQILLDTISVSTAGLRGYNRLIIEVNPKDLTTGLIDQPEQHLFNNQIQIPFFVSSDRINPILDVTFDGRYIMNGDIVSSRPEIQISVDDENPFYTMDEPSDTSRVKIFISTPQAAEIPVYFSSGNLTFIPATSPANKLVVKYYPEFNLDGKYKVRVQATDKNGNPSGQYDYEINFNVVNSPGITGVLNYPNPFSTSTRFVYTLTGREVPDQFKIQIMTVTGKIVREITQDELGPMYIGKNITDFAWNGTDEFGDRLANGVYLYRIVARLNGHDLEIISSGADQYITKGFGKMYLFR